MTDRLSDYADTYGNPGPEGPRFWGFLGFSLGLCWLIYVTAPFWGLAN